MVIELLEGAEGGGGLPLPWHLPTYTARGYLGTGAVMEEGAGLHTPKSEGPSLLQGSALAGAEMEA